MWVDHVGYSSNQGQVFGFISASLLCYLHSSEWLTHSNATWAKTLGKSRIFYELVK